MTGNTASTIGTAPRRPTQEMKVISRPEKCRGLRHSQTEIGRATNISTSETPSAGHSVRSNSEGVTSKPSNKNMPACDSHAYPSMADKDARTWRRARLPTTTPIR